MAAFEFGSAEWNASCLARPATIRVDALVSESYRQFNYFLIAFVATYYLVGLVAFGYAKRTASSSYIGKRNFLALWFATASVFCILGVGPIRDIVGREGFSCQAMLWLRVSTVCFALLPISTRIIFFREQMLWARAKKSISFQKLQQIIQSDAELPSSHSSRKSVFSKFSSAYQSTRIDGEQIVAHTDSVDEFEHKPPTETGSQVSENRKGMSSGASSMDEADFERLMKRQTMAFKAAAISLPAIPLLIFAIIYQFSFSHFRDNCPGCYEDTLFWVLTGATVGLSIAATAVVGFLVRKSPDPLGLLWEVKWLIITASPLGFAGLLGNLVDQYSGRPYDRGVFSFDWIIIFALIVQFTWLAYVPLMAAYKMHQRVSGARYDFQSFLSNPRSLKIFSDHLVNEWAIENLKFWSQVESFRNQYSHFRKIREGNLVAWQTFNTFVRPGAVMDVNIPSAVREQLCRYFENHMTEDPDFSKKAIPATLFDEAQREVFALMEKDSFQRFQSTKTFKAFVSENTVLDAAKQRLVVVTAGGAVV